MGHCSLLLFLVGLALRGGLIWTDAAVLVQRATESLSSPATSRRILRAATTSTTAQHLLRATVHLTHSTPPIPTKLLSSSSSSSSASSPKPPPAPHHGSLSSYPHSPRSPPRPPPTYLSTFPDAPPYLPSTPPSPPLRLTVSLTAGVALQTRSTSAGGLLLPEAAPASLCSFDVGVDCDRMAALVVANLTDAAAAAGMHFTALPLVERCSGGWFSVRADIEGVIAAPACGPLSDAIYQELPRWVNAALGRVPAAAVACGGGGGCIDEEYVTTAWAYDSIGGSEQGCVALAYAHTC